ncbi:hypothetical protein EST38_g9682 [Candolleomyces aberdarensis]|uniref:Uncharacterized protein n=1 Tax=Candolleomyces aberdarensis TaxID=2316362 RepID=A0A4Q2DCL3_9AGAR|nr:hypothetical protein EST38_g9682 [Candolleomyces aberdarensis]
MAITTSDVIGPEAVKAAQKTFRHCVAASQSSLPPQRREQAIQKWATKILKEWTLGLVISRILSGQVPNQRELIDMCNLMVDTPEVLMILWESRLRDDVPYDTATTKWRQLLRWFDELLRSILFYTIQHIFPNAHIFPDYADSWPIDSALKMKTLVLASTGAYMHLYSRREDKESIKSFNMMLDSYQHPTAINAHKMAANIQSRPDSSPYHCHLLSSQAIDKIVAFSCHSFVHTSCSVMTLFLTGQSKIVNNQLSKANQPPGMAYLLVPFCCSIITIAIAGVEEFGHEVSVAKIIDHPGIMDLLYSKAGFTRDFMNYIHSEGTQSEKDDIEWLNTAVKVRAAMAIQPFHESVVADLGSIVRPRRAVKLSCQFASLESQSDFEKTYKAYDSDESLPPVLAAHLADARAEAQERLDLRREMRQAMLGGSSLSARKRRPSFFGGLGKRAFETLEGDDQMPLDVPGESSRSKKGKRRAEAASLAGSPMDSINED